ncbi:MAG: hypothetical protein KatS3mg022_2535 [Armatimonadota bacterium]|nr:MAG: hypothetical protein KatS3mg022_2535 [Armatimonadota bacterium]
MSSDYVEPEDLSALETFLQVEHSIDVHRALRQLYSTQGCEHLAVLALRYGFGYDLRTIAFIMNRQKKQVERTLHHCLQQLADYMV